MKSAEFLLILLVVFAGAFVFSLVTVVNTVRAEPPGQNKEDEGPKSICPTTLMEGDVYSCMKCHMMRRDKKGRPVFGLKEVATYAELTESAPANTHVIDRDGKPIVWHFLTTIKAWDVKALYDWLSWHPELRHIVVDIQSPGGSLFEAERIVGLMSELKVKGYTIETRCYGFAASAGFYVFVNGSKGHRYASEYAELMWHELITFSFYDISGPADKEDEAAVLRHLQDGRNERIAAVTNMTKDQLDAKIRKKEFWINGREALKWGVADHLLDVKK